MCADKTEDYEHSVETYITCVTHRYMDGTEFSKHLVYLYPTNAVYGFGPSL